MTYKYDWDDKHKFIHDLKCSINMSDFLKRQNLGATSGNFRTFKKKIAEHGIDLRTIFQLMPETKKYKHKKETDLSALLCLNSKYSNEFIKKNIKKNNVIEYKCSCCGNSGIWNNRSLNLQLEHKNGNSQDNRIENLEYLCPNCHSQTNTFTGKNKALNLIKERLQYCNDNQIEIINRDNIEKISIDWNLKQISARLWILKNKSIFMENGIHIEIQKNNKSYNSLIKNKISIIEDSYKNIDLEEMASIIKCSVNDLKNFIKIYCPKIYSEIFNIKEELKIKAEKMLNSLGSYPLESCVIKFSEEWNLSEKEAINWIRRNDKSLYSKIKLLKSNSVSFINEQLNFEQRKNLVLQVNNKKELPNIAKRFGVSTNGLKKWIRNNMPEHFMEIYDDRHLVKNKSRILKQERENYIKSLSEGFDEEEALKILNTNKPGLFALISKYNYQLIEKLHSQYLCPKCSSKSRSSGKKRRCISCNHEFKVE